MPEMKIAKKKLGALIFAASILLGALAFIISFRVRNLQSFGYLGVFIANLLGSATIIFPVPSFATTIAVGAFLSPIVTAVFSSLGSTLGELTGYFAGLGGEIANGNKKVEKVKKWMDKYGLWVIFVLAAIPNPLFDFAGIISGITKLSLKKYLPIVFAGKLIKFTVLAYTGFGFFKLLRFSF